MIDDTLTAGGNSTDPAAAAAAMENSQTGEKQTSVYLCKTLHVKYIIRKIFIYLHCDYIFNN